MMKSAVNALYKLLWNLDHYCPHEMFPDRNDSRLKYQLDLRPLPKSKGLSAWGNGLEGKGRGSDKGPITVAKGVLGRLDCRPLRLVSTSYAFPVSCHGRGQEPHGRIVGKNEAAGAADAGLCHILGPCVA
jgi:hypothetical protein